jgi:hypothetical protein
MKSLWAPLFALLLYAAPGFCASPGFAKDSSQYTYQDGVLQGFHREQPERDCIEGSAISGSATNTGSSSCADEYTVVYTVESGGAIYILTPRGDTDESKCGLLIRATIRHSVLENQRPRTPIKLRSDGRHFFVRIGDRESEYSVARIE